MQAGQAFASHETVEYGKGEYVRGVAHINTVEDYFSQLKKSMTEPITMCRRIICIGMFPSLIIATIPARLKTVSERGKLSE